MGHGSDDGRGRAQSALLVASLVLGSIGATTPVRAQAPPVEELLARAEAYASEFVFRFSNVIAEEHSRQQIIDRRGAQELVADFLIVPAPGAASEWTTFRDVFQVNGEPVRDHDQRLLALFLAPPSTSTAARAQAIADESTRYHLMDVGSLSNPLQALAFVQERYNERFRWSEAGRDKDVGADVWKVRFRESVRPTLLRGAGGSDARITGRAWIDATTGRILKTELDVSFGYVRGVDVIRSKADRFLNRGGNSLNEIPVEMRSVITTLFAFDERFGIAVPVEMRESHTRAGGTLRSVATYGRFRSFTVDTTETFVEPTTCDATPCAPSP